VSDTETRKGQSRSATQIFGELHRELRAWNSKIPESPERMDPILRILLQIYSSQLAQIDQRVEETWNVATRALIKSVAPEGRRWPIPAFTVMRCKPKDPVVDVDPYTRFFYRERREGGQTFFFSAPCKQRLLSAALKHAYLVENGIAVNISPGQDFGGGRSSRPGGSVSDVSGARIYLAIEFAGAVSAFRRSTIFIKGLPDALRQMRWAHWLPCASNGFDENHRFCPGMNASVSDLFSSGNRDIDWGGLRTTGDLFKSLENNFVTISEEFCSRWESVGTPDELTSLLSRSGVSAPARDGKYFWIRLDLPRGGDRRALLNPSQMFFDSFIALNKNELKLFKHTGGNRLVEIELPEEISTVLDITQVTDSNGREYFAQHELPSKRSVYHYTIEERENRLVLWFDFFLVTELPPESLTVVYTVTSGVSANGIEAGKINELYESHPGIQSAENLTPATGAIPAKTDDQIVAEVGSRLRNRDRVLSFSEIANWVMSFDPRIQGASCENGIQRGEHGVRRCIVVHVQVPSQEIYSDDEVHLLQFRLHQFLKSRSPVNTQFRVEIVNQ
jgi:hypothetical protein